MHPLQQLDELYFHRNVHPQRPFEESSRTSLLSEELLPKCYL